MDNNKISRSANRLAGLSIVLGIILVISGLFGSALFLGAFSTQENFLILLLPVLVSLVIVFFFVLLPGIRIKKNRNNLSKVRGSLALLLLAGIYGLITGVSNIVRVLKGQIGQHPIMLLMILIIFVISFILISDSLKLLKVAKTEVSSTDV